MTGQQITMKLKKTTSELFSPAFGKSIVAKMAKKSVELMWDRNEKGIDNTGIRYGGYNSSYTSQKRKLIAGTMKGRGGKGASKTLARYNAMKTSYAARRVGDYLRLTGQLRKDTDWNITQYYQNKDFVNMSWRIRIKPRSEGKARGLQSTRGRNKYTSYRKKAFYFLGLTRRGGLQKAEQKALTAIASKALKDKLTLLQTKLKAL